MPMSHKGVNVTRSGFLTIGQHIFHAQALPRGSTTPRRVVAREKRIWHGPCNNLAYRPIQRRNLMKLASLHDLFVDELKDLYNAETQLTKALPKMAKAAASQELRTAFEKHLEETEHQIERLDIIFKQLETTARGKRCKAMTGLIEEGKEMIEMEGEEAVKDAGLIAAAQRVEHYEMAGYGTVRTYAHLLGFDEAANLLQETLDEEAAANQELNELAENINVAAQAPA
jgi:ferritin-like metal-binding protein YciE